MKNWNSKPSKVWNRFGDWWGRGRPRHQAVQSLQTLILLTPQVLGGERCFKQLGMTPVPLSLGRGKPGQCQSQCFQISDALFAK
jgi:hypothetical protein